MSRYADELTATLQPATLGNCLEIARQLVALANHLGLPPPATYEVEPLQLDQTPYPREARRRLQIPLRSEVKKRLGFESDELFPYSPTKWYFHITTEFVEATLVDVVTGARGHPRFSYLDAFFLYSDSLRLTPYDVFQEGEPV